MRVFVASVCLMLIAGCSLDVGAIVPVTGGDAESPDSSGLDSGAPDSSPTDGSVDAARDSTVADTTVPPDGPPIDAGPPMPTEVVRVAESGSNSGHPTVIWDGTRFVVAVIVAVGDGNAVDVFAMDVGDTTPIDRHRVAGGGGRERRSAELAAAADGRLAVGWHEWDGSEWDVVVTIESSSPSVRRRYSGVASAADHESVVLFWQSGELMGVVRDDGPGAQWAREVRFDPEPVVAEPGPFAVAANLGGMNGASTAAGPVVVIGGLGTTFRHTTSFLTVDASGVPAPVEASVTSLPGGSLFSLWLGEPGGVRDIYARRVDPSGPLLLPGLSTRGLGWSGSDPTIDTVGDEVVAAYVDASMGGRTIVVAQLDRDADVIGGPCRLTNERPSANDPTIACGGGYCALVWLEATRYGDLDHATRVVQLPVSPLVCP